MVRRTASSWIEVPALPDRPGQAHRCMRASSAVYPTYRSLLVPAPATAHALRVCISQSPHPIGHMCLTYVIYILYIHTRTDVCMYVCNIHTYTHTYRCREIIIPLSESQTARLVTRTHVRMHGICARSTRLGTVPVRVLFIIYTSIGTNFSIYI